MDLEKADPDPQHRMQSKNLLRHVSSLKNVRLSETVQGVWIVQIICTTRRWYTRIPAAGLRYYKLFAGESEVLHVDGVRGRRRHAAAAVRVLHGVSAPAGPPDIHSHQGSTRQQEIAPELLTLKTLSSEIAVFRIRLDPIHFDLPDPTHETPTGNSS